MPALGTVATLLRLAPQYALFAALKRRVSLHRLAHYAWKETTGAGRRAQGAGEGSSPPARRSAEEARAIACVVRLHQLLGGPADDCLPRSLLLYRELSRLGADPKLCIGFKSAPSELLGHAWVEVDGKVVGETASGPGGFTKQLTFGTEGERTEGSVR